MASETRPGTVSDGRKVATAVLAVIGTFTLAASLGAGSWVLTALGIALIGGGIALYTVSRASSGNPGRMSRRLAETGLDDEGDPPDTRAARESTFAEETDPEFLVPAGAGPSYIELEVHDPAARRSTWWPPARR